MFDVLQKTEYSSIGLDIDKHEVRAVQLVRTQEEILPYAWAIFPRFSSDGVSNQALPNQSELRWIKEIITRRGFVGNACSMMIPNNKCSAHVLELPPHSSGAPIDQLARIEVARERVTEPNAFEMGYWETPRKGRAPVETRAIACDRTGIESMIDQFDQAQVDLIGLDANDLVIQRACSGMISSSDDEIHTVIHIGWDQSHVVQLLGDVVIYSRTIEHGVKRVWEHAINTFHLSPRAAQRVLDHHAGTDDQGQNLVKISRSAWSTLVRDLVDGIDVSLGYVTHSYRMAPIGKMIVLGYAYGNELLESQIEEVLGLRVEYGFDHHLLIELGAGDRIHAWATRLSVAHSLARRFDQ